MLKVYSFIWAFGVQGVQFLFVLLVQASELWQALWIISNKAKDRIAQKLLFFSHHVYLNHQKSNSMKE